MMDLCAELETILRVARKAAEVVMRIYATDFTVEWKDPRNPVTEADRAANTLACEQLASLFPGVPIVSEEGSEYNPEALRTSLRTLFVDPLDGTRGFVDRVGEFAVMIGLVENNVPIAGAVVAPALGTTWIGAEGVGAWQIAPDDTRLPIHVSNTNRLDRASAVITPVGNKRLEEALRILGVAHAVTCGGAGIKGARVAAGLTDLYVQTPPAGQRWDACAPEAILRAAGGRVSDFSGQPLDYTGELENNRGFIMTNGVLHEAAVERLTLLQ